MCYFKDLIFVIYNGFLKYLDLYQYLYLVIYNGFLEYLDLYLYLLDNIILPPEVPFPLRNYNSNLQLAIRNPQSRVTITPELLTIFLKRTIELDFVRGFSFGLTRLIKMR